MTTPAEEFAALFADDATAPETPSEVADTTPRTPRPNLAQGATADPPKPDPAQAFADMIRDTIAGYRGDGGWTAL